MKNQAIKRDFLSIKQLSNREAHDLIKFAIKINENKLLCRNKLKNKVVGTYFKSSSTRTRTAFTLGAHKLGAAVINYGPNDLQISTGETLKDTGCILANFLDILVVRSNESLNDLKELAMQNNMCIINAMSECEHQTQVIGDMVAIHETIGRFQDIHIAYYGEGNNTAKALALLAAKLGNIKLTLHTPVNYRIPDALFTEINSFAKKTGSQIEQIHDASIIPKDVDIVYTTRWQTMGVKHKEPDWLNAFKPFQINQKLIKNIATHSTHKISFMHDLPAIRELDTSSEILDSSYSIAFRQAYHKLTGAIAVYCWVSNVSG